MDTLLHLLSPSYLFHKNHGPFTSDLADVFLWANIGLVALAILVKVITRKGDRFAKKAAAKFTSCAWTMGAIGVILYAFRQINVLYLSAPVFILMWAMATAVWLVLVANYCLRVVPKRREAVARESETRDYA